MQYTNTRTASPDVAPERESARGDVTPYLEVTDSEWALVSALAAQPMRTVNQRGRPRADPRIVLDAVLWHITTGERWSRLPSHYPTAPTCRRRFIDWSRDGTLIEIVGLLASTGRVFSYVPKPVAAPSNAPDAEGAQPASAAGPSVRWLRPEEWQTRDASLQESELQHASSRAPVTHEMARMHEDRRRRAAGVRPSASPCKVIPLVDGYEIHAIAREVAHGMFRGWAEVFRNGRRVERSGLIGPRCVRPDQAHEHARAWAEAWLESQGGVASRSGALRQAFDTMSTRTRVPEWKHRRRP
jgi:transposase